MRTHKSQHSFSYTSKDLETCQTKLTHAPPSSRPEIQVTFLIQKENKQAETTILAVSDKCKYTVLNPEKVCVENSSAGQVIPFPITVFWHVGPIPGG